MGTSEIQLGNGCQYMDLAAVLGHAAEPGFLKAELLLDHPERMLNLCSDVSFASHDQILQLPFWCIGEHSLLARHHCHPEFRFFSFYLGPLAMPWWPAITAPFFRGWAQFYRVSLTIKKSIPAGKKGQIFGNQRF